MADPLLVLDVDVEVPYEDKAAVSADALAPARELARLHLSLHYVDA
jgi:hypothetical protein